MIPDSFKQDLLNRVDIVDVVGRCVQLKKAGANYLGLCPFHGEKTPSFNVNPDRGFHCFGCGVGGDVFKFVELQEKVGFQDAVRHLAARFGIPLPEMEGGSDQGESAAEREALIKIHEVALAYFREQLAAPGGAKVREYLAGARGLKQETIDQLQIGYAPPARDALRQRLLKSGFSPTQLLTSGLITRRDDGSDVDRFRNRLMIPIARDAGARVGRRRPEAEGQEADFLHWAKW